MLAKGLGVELLGLEADGIDLDCCSSDRGIASSRVAMLAGVAAIGEQDDVAGARRLRRRAERGKDLSRAS